MQLLQKRVQRRPAAPFTVIEHPDLLIRLFRLVIEQHVGRIVYRHEPAVWIGRSNQAGQIRRIHRVTFPGQQQQRPAVAFEYLHDFGMCPREEIQQLNIGIKGDLGESIVQPAGLRTISRE
ncbi:hypothetical protein D3C73_928630 [compost metagenome]